MKELIKLATNIAKSEGINKTHLPQVHIYKTSSDSKRAPLIYNQGIIFVLQGEKRIYSEGQKLIYNPNSYLVITVPLPLECEAILKNGKPLIGVAIDIQIPMLNQIINLMDDHETFAKINESEKATGIYTSKVDSDFQSIVLRLLQSLQNPLDAKVLGEGLLKELLFKIIRGKDAAPLYALALKNTNLSKIEVALKEIHRNYQEQFDVDSLASLVNMSVSSFHHTFKKVTSSSPIQYIKKVRLNKAKDFIIENGLRVNEAAREVGYESVSQFNREFKRYFGVTPGSINL